MHLPLRDEGASIAATPAGDQCDQLCSTLYEELRRQAHRLLCRERRHHTLQTTELIHEAYLRLGRKPYLNGVARSHFLALAARAMRETLTDDARRRRALKRGGGQDRVHLDEAVLSYSDSMLDVIALDEALVRLAAVGPRMTRIIELRFFGGLTEQQAADVLGVSDRTIRREWRIARLWLSREMGARDRDDT